MTTILEAAQSLLVEVAQILNEAKVNYVIVGGWSPYLRCTKHLKHPGTKDVDVLFSDAYAEGGIREIIKIFLKSDYLVSAKHDFQLLKTIEVDNHKLVFNIDLLHPSESKFNPELLVDHLDLHINERDIGNPKFVRSMVLPSSKILFEPSLFSIESVTSPITGNIAQIPIITEVGCVLSKCESVKLEKRKRDSFDIYLSLTNIGSAEFAKIIREYSHIKGIVAMLEALRAFVGTPSHENDRIMEFDSRVYRYAKQTSISPKPSEIVIEALDAV